MENYDGERAKTKASLRNIQVLAFHPIHYWLTVENFTFPADATLAQQEAINAEACALAKQLNDNAAERDRYLNMVMD